MPIEPQDSHSSIKCQQEVKQLSQQWLQMNTNQPGYFRLPTPRAAMGIIQVANLKRCRSQENYIKLSQPSESDLDHSILNLKNFQVLSSSSKPQSFASHALSSLSWEIDEDWKLTKVGHNPQFNQTKARQIIGKDRIKTLKNRLQKQSQEALLKLREIQSKLRLRREQKRQILQRSKSPIVINVLKPSYSNCL